MFTGIFAFGCNTKNSIFEHFHKQFRGCSIKTKMCQHRTRNGSMMKGEGIYYIVFGRKVLQFTMSDIYLKRDKMNNFLSA